MKRIYFLLILILCINIAQAEVININLEKRTTYYKIGMEMSIKYYDSVLHSITQARSKQQLSEYEYTSTYAKAKKQYEQQQKIVANIAEILADKGLQKTKAIKKSIEAFAKNKPKEAIQIMQNACAESENVANYFFKIEIEKIIGRHDEALKTIENAKKINDNFIIEYASELHFIGQDSLAKIYCDNAIKNAGTDTIKIVKAKRLLSEIMDKQFAAAPLIEAEYLLEKYTKNSSETKVLLAATQHQLALLYLSNSEIENAFRAAENSVKNITRQGFDEEINYNQTFAVIYKTAGANDKALTIFENLNKLYPKYLESYPELYLPKYVAMLEQYGEVLKYFDKLKEYDEMLHFEVEKRRNQLSYKYPFFVLGYIENQNRLAQKLINTDVKIFLAEVEWKKANEAFSLLKNKDIMLIGGTQCQILYKLATIQYSLKNIENAKVYLDQSLAIREQMYALAPTENKSELTEALMFIAKVNIMLKNTKLGLKQLDRAIDYLKDIEVKGGNDKLEELKKYRNEIANQ